MVDAFKILLDGVDRGQSPEKFGIQVNFNSDINGRFISFENEVKLTGAAYEYIIGVARDQYCGRIKVDCLYICQGSAAKVIATGFIFPSDCVFDRDKCTLTTKIVDSAFQSRVNNNKSILIYSKTPETKNLLPIGSPVGELVQRVQMFRPSDQTYLGQYSYGWSVFNAFKIIVSFMSDGEMDFESNYFETGAGNCWFLTSGASIRTGRDLQFLYSFESLYTAFNRKLRLGFGFKTVNGRPVMVIEDFEFFRNNPPVISLTDIRNIITRYDRESLYATIDLGSEEFLEEWESTNDQRALSFSQVRFYGFKKESFGLTGVCNFDRKFDLVTRNVIFDTNIIEDILMNNNQGFEENPICIEVPAYIGSAATWADKNAGFVDLFGSGTAQYNPQMVNNRQAGNNIDGVPASIWNYYQGYAPALTPFQGNSAFVDHTFTFSASPINPSYYSDPDKANKYFEFATEIIDAGNNYEPIVFFNPAPLNGSMYIVPAPGLYTFNARIKRKKDTGPGSTTGFQQRIMFVRYNSDFNKINTIYANVSGQAAGFDGCDVGTVTTFCNEGDRIFVDLEVEIVAGLSFDYIFTKDITVGICFDQPFSFYGYGQPIQGGELQPADPNKFKAFIDSFKAPLTYQQITDLIEDTTGSIGYTDQEDELSIIDGDVMKITISSLGTNIADFELKTNRI